MKKTFRDMLSAGIPVIYDGAMGTELQKEKLGLDAFEGKFGCNEILNVSSKDSVRGVYTKYLQAGANVVETNTFGGNRFKLDEYGIGDRVLEINKSAAIIAREAVENSGNEYAFVCGSMGPTGFLPSSTDPEMGKFGYDDLMPVYQEQTEALIAGGVDLILLETMQDLLEVRAAFAGVRRAMAKANVNLPIQIQITMDAAGHMLLGSDIMAFLGAVANLKPDVMGLNCSTGPDEMKPHILKLLKYFPGAVSMIPNAGLPQNIDGHAVYDMPPDQFAEKLSKIVIDHGVHVVGGCCGTTPEHIKALAESLNGVKISDTRNISKDSLFLSTGLSGIELSEQKMPIIIGERLNTQGSKKTRELVLDNNYDELIQLGLGQQNKGADLLDLCMAVNERDDEPETMVSIVRALRDRVSTPFCIDSTDIAVFESSLKHCPGSSLLNSINLTKDCKKAKNVLKLAKEYGCPVIALPIDDGGMAKTVDQKVEMADRIHSLVCDEFEIPENWIFFDPLVFTLATGEKDMASAAVDSLEAMKIIKSKYPKIRFTMGVSNVSFGLKPRARRMINNLMLHHAVEAGLDSGIFNPIHLDDISKYKKNERNLCEDLIFNRTPDALEKLIEYFENLTPEKKKKDAEIRNELPPSERLRASIMDRDKRGLNELLELLLKDLSANDILNKILLPAMGEVGDKMATGEMILPFVLQAAEVMKSAVAILEPYFEKDQSSSKGKLLLATVEGDIHDIGKNLVGSILKNQGYEIIDLGKSVSIKDIIEAAQREEPDALGLSALLVTTSRNMGVCVKELEKINSKVPVLIGGAAVNRDFATRMAITNESGKTYAPGVYYGKDAFEAAKILEELKSGKINRKNISETDSASLPAESVENNIVKDDKIIVNNAPKVEFKDVIEPMFFGTSDMLTWDSNELLTSINKKRLYKGYWRTGRLTGDAFERTVITDLDPAYEQLKKEILDNNLLDARGFYGIWPVYSDDDIVYILKPDDLTTEIAHFKFPRVERKKGRSIADWIRPEGDVIALQVVTVGGLLAKRSREYFQKEDKYSFGFFLDGIGNFLTEELADRVTAEIRRAMFLPDKTKQGRRYGFGYPGLPGLDKQKVLLDLMCAEDRLGISLTSGFQMIPEHSTATVFIYHPDAEYM